MFDWIISYGYQKCRDGGSEQLFYQTLTYYLKMVPAYDVVIVGDDAAFQFAMTYQDEPVAQTPVVFRSQ